MPLERAERLAVGALAQRDAEWPGLADDAAPERVVEIEHQHLLRPGQQRANARPEVLGEPDRARLAERLLGPVYRRGS